MQVQPGDIVRIEKRQGFWVVDHREKNAVGKQLACFRPTPMRRARTREGITAPEQIIELMIRPRFDAGMVVQYRRQPATVVEDAGEIVLLNFTRRHDFRGGGFTTHTNLGRASGPAAGKPGHEGQPVSKAELTAENFDFFVERQNHD